MEIKNNPLEMGELFDEFFKNYILRLNKINLTSIRKKWNWFLW